MKKIMLVAALTVGFMGSAFAEVDKDAVINYRQGIYDVVGWNMGILAGMVKGEIEFDATKAKNAAVLINEMSKAAPESFIKDTYEGSNAKAKLEENRDDFNKKMQAWVDESQAMLVASEKKETLAPQLGKLGQTCKSCHDAYKAD